MAKRTINLGTSANKGDGDPLRTAFTKINDNFTEVYGLLGADEVDTDDVIAPMLVHNNHTNVTVTRDDDADQIIFTVDQAVTDLQGSVYGDDSTLLVDGVNNVINLDGTISGDVVPDANEAYDLGSATNRFRDLYLSGSTIDLGGTTLSVVGGVLQIGGTDINDVVTAAGINSLTAGSNIPTLETAYNDARAVLDALLDAGDYGAQLAPPSDYTYYGIAVQQKALNPLIPDEVVDEALNVLNAYNAWQNEIEAETATITVGDREWKFKGDGTVDGLNVDGDITGSVFSDDSTLLVDGVNGKIVGDVHTDYIETAVLRSRTGQFLGIFGQENATGDGSEIRITGGTSTDTENFGFGGSVVIQAGENPNALQQDGGINIGTDHTNGVTIGAYDFGNGFGTIVNISGVRNYIGESGNRSTTYLRGTVDFSDATVSELNVDLTGNFQGSVFADDSTLLVDGVNGKIVGDIQNNLIETNNITALPGDTDLYIQGGIDSGTPGNPARVNIGTTNTSTIILGASDSLIYVNGNDDSIIGGGTGIFGTITGDLTGSVFSDDSTLLVDGINGKITGDVETTSVTAIGIKASVIDNNGGPLQIKAGLTTDTGNTIFINPYGSNTFIQSQAETYTWLTGPYLDAGPNPSLEFKTAGAFKALDGAFFEGNLTGNVTGDVVGSVFGDDSTLLIDGVSGKINLQNTVLNNTISTINDEALYLNTATIPGDRGGRITTTDNIFDIYGATLEDGNGGGVWLAGGLADPGKQQGDVIISGRFISLLGGDYDGSGGIVFNGPVVGRMVGDIQGSVFGDDSTTLVDGVNGVIPSVEQLKADIKAAAAASIDFTDFQARIAAL